MRVSGEKGRTPLHLAAESGHIDVVRALAEERGAIFDREYSFGLTTPLHMAAENGHADVVHVLIKEFGGCAKP